MAHGWNSYFHNISPLSSDPRTLRRTSESEGSHSQHIENITGQYDFPGTAASCEATATNSNFNTSYFSNSSAGDSRPDCVYQRYYNETPWQADGAQMEKQSSQGCGNADTDFAPDGSSFFSGDLQGLKQDHGMLATSFHEDYSDVSSCSDPDVCEARPSCKFMTSNSVQKPKPCVSIKHKSSEWRYTETKNMTFPSNSSCSKIGDNSVILPRSSNVKAGENIVNYAQDKMESPENTDKSCAVDSQYTPNEMSRKSDESESVEDINNYDGHEEQKQKENVDRDLVQREHSNLDDVEVKRKYPHDQKEQISATALNNVTLIDDRQDNFDKLYRMEMKGSLNQEDKVFDNRCSPDGQDRNLKEAENDKSEAPKGEIQKTAPSENENISNPTSTNVQNDNIGEKDEHKSEATKGEIQKSTVSENENTSNPTSTNVQDENLGGDEQNKSEALKGERKESAPLIHDNLDNENISNPTSTDGKNVEVSRDEQDKNEALNVDMKDFGLLESDNPNNQKSPNSNIQDETVNKDKQEKKDLPKEELTQSGLLENENFDKVDISNPTSSGVRDLNLSKDVHDKSDVLKGEMKHLGSIEIEDSNGKKSPNVNFNDGLIEDKEKECQDEKTQSNTSSARPDIKMSVCKDATLELGENLTTLESNTHVIESCLQLSKHHSYKNVAEENISQSPSVMSNGLFSDASDKNKGGIDTQPESSSEINSFVRDVKPCPEKEWTSTAKKKNATPCPDHNGPSVTSDNFSIDTSALKKEGIASHEESCLEPYSSGKDINPFIDKEITRPPEKNTITICSNMECGGHVLTSDNEGQLACGRSALCVQSNTPCMDINQTHEKEWTSPARNPISNSSQDQPHPPDQSPVALEPSGFSGGVTQNATGSFEGLDTEVLMHDVSHDKPLLREDSSCDTDETKLDSQYKDTPFALLDDNMDNSEGQKPKLESATQMRMHLHPVVILKTFEMVNGIRNSYCCAVCQHTTKNADELIGHHHCCHSVYNFQFCKTCNLYPINDNQAEKHVCGVTMASPELHYIKRKKRSNLPRSHTCIKCRLKFLKFYHYVKHMRSHTGKTPFQCNECGLYFSQSSTLRRHKLKPGRCKQKKLQSVSNSDATSGSGTSLQVDMLQSQCAKLPECYVKLVDISKLHLCHFCGKSFVTARKAKKHFYNVHGGKIQEHVQSQPNTKPSAEKIRKVANETSRIYKCPFCPRIFKYTYNRSRHLRDCVREKVFGGKEKVGDKYLCPLCQATFTTTSSRYRHIKTFCLRDYIYNRLGKENAKALQNSHLKKTKETEQKSPLEENEQKKQEPQALTTSKTEPRYKCNLCPAVFWHPSGIYRHKKKHELFKLTGKMFRYRHSVSSTVAKPLALSTTKTEESKDDLKSTEEVKTPSLSCHFCGKCFSTLQSLKKHEHNHKGDRPYSCLECGNRFKRQSHLISHKTVHQRRIQCTVCRKILSSIKELIQHRSSHPKRGKLQCPDCDLQFDYPAHLLRHIGRRHKKENKALELEETPQLKPQQSLKPVKDEDGLKPLKCSLCKEVFYDSQVLRKHCLTHISGSLLNQCPFCKKNCASRQYLLRHMNKHTGYKGFSCTVCGKQFYREKHLILHRQQCSPAQTHPITKESGTKKEGSHRCSYCPRVFCKKTRLKNHLRGHKNNSLLHCSKCEKYYGMTKLNTHQKDCLRTELDSGLSSNDNLRKSTSQISQDVNKVAQQPGVEILKLKCPHCTQRFRFRSLLLRHIVSHTGLQPYACVHCGHRFRSQTKCVEHEAFCDGVKAEQSKVKGEAAVQLSNMPTIREMAKKRQAEKESQYKCKFCTKTFMKPRSLRCHILTHNEVKPYRCKACDNCFSRYDHLKIHQIRCKERRSRLEVCIPKISLDDVGKGWQNRFSFEPTEKQEMFECKICSRLFPTQSKLSRHNTLFHVAKLFKCTGCGSSFSHEKTLKYHKKIKKCRTKNEKAPEETNCPIPMDTVTKTENVKKPNEVSKCSDWVTVPPDGTRNRILLRIQPHFNKKYKYICSYCPRAFANTYQLRVHICLHTGEKPYACDYCGKRFIRKDYVLRHYVNCSKKSKQKLCDKCGGLFSKLKLESHKRTCTSTSVPSKSTDDQCEQSTSKNPPKGFSCAYCSCRFLLFSQLQEHFLNAHKMETMFAPATTVPLQHHLLNLPNVKEEPLDKSCDEQSSDGAKLICQLGTALEVSKPFSCSQCNISFVRRSGLTTHMRMHTREHLFNCKKCKKGFWNKTTLRNHHRKCRFGSKSESNSAQTIELPVMATTGTDVLQTNFDSKEDFQSESSNLTEGNKVQDDPSKDKKVVQYQCSECDKSFTDGLMLISHLEDHGREEQDKKHNTCTKCGRVFSSQGYLEKHMKMHRIDKKYSCPDCPKMFYTSADLDIHLTCHDQNRPYACKLCDQRFWTRPYLSNHYNDEHPDNVFSCRFCNKSYSVKKSLARHYKTWHQHEQKDNGTAQEKSAEKQSSSQVSTTGESHEDEDETEDSDSDSAPYFPCHVCGKTFPTSESLEDHQRCHLGEKPHECAECGRCFFQASQLQQHQRMHKSEFQCQACGRGFVTLFALRNHKHTHGKNRPHRCSKCGFSFTGPTQLAEHMSTHREENFPCDICNHVFRTKSSRAEHRKSHSKSGDHQLHSDSGEEHENSYSVTEGTSAFTKELKYRCGVCSERFEDPEKLSEHGCVAAKERPYSCSDCEKYFLHASHLKKHRSTHQLSWDRNQYPCNQCNNSFSSSQQFLSHLRSHDDTAKETKCITEAEDPSNCFICPVCHQSCDTAAELVSHFDTHADCLFECKTCEMTFSSGSMLKEHQCKHVTSATQFECTECGQSFLGRDAFRQHHCFRQQPVKTGGEYLNPSVETSPNHKVPGEEEDVDVTGEDLYYCRICSMQFSSKSVLLEHQNKRHPNKRSFKCELCGKTFALRRYLKEHERRHRQKLAVQTSLAENKLKCTKCHTEFNTTQEMTLHLRHHAENEVGEFRCDMCYKSFNQWSLLKQHQESHVGQVVYECNECDKAFAFPHLLEEHQQTHAGSSQ